MARICWSGIGPWHKTGYGVLTAEFVPRLRGLGHEIVIAIMGEKGDRHPLNHPDAAETKTTGRWQGIPVIGPGITEFGLPYQHEIRDAFGGREPDLVLVLKDAWVLRPHSYRRYNTAVWLFTDTDQLGVPDRQFFAEAPAVRPLPVSLHGLASTRAAGLSDARWLPAGIDTEFWSPGHRDGARNLLGLPRDMFIAGIDAANIGPRKGWGEQLAAFAAFHGKHPSSLLLIHAVPEHPEGLNLRQLAYHLELNKSPDDPMAGDAVQFGAHYNMTAGQMLSWYRSLDVLLAASYGEGYGLSIVQAQACGIPVIGTDCTAVTEKIPPGMGWLVKGQPWWNPHHQAWWMIPNVQGITTALGKAARQPPTTAIRDWAVRQYDADTVVREYWKQVIDELLEASP